MKVYLYMQFRQDIKNDCEVESIIPLCAYFSEYEAKGRVHEANTSPTKTENIEYGYMEIDLK